MKLKPNKPFFFLLIHTRSTPTHTISIFASSLNPHPSHFPHLQTTPILLLILSSSQNSPLEVRSAPLRSLSSPTRGASFRWDLRRFPAASDVQSSGKLLSSFSSHDLFLLHQYHQHFFTPFFFPTAQWLFQHFLAKQRLNPVRKPVYSGPKQHW